VSLFSFLILPQWGTTKNKTVPRLLIRWKRSKVTAYEVMLRGAWRTANATTTTEVEKTGLNSECCWISQQGNTHTHTHLVKGQTRTRGFYGAEQLSPVSIFRSHDLKFSTDTSIYFSTTHAWLATSWLTQVTLRSWLLGIRVKGWHLAFTLVQSNRMSPNKCKQWKQETAWYQVIVTTYGMTFTWAKALFKFLENFVKFFRSPSHRIFEHLPET
jgi:hypothetical protein